MSQPFILEHQPAEIAEKVTERSIRSLLGIAGMMAALCFRLLEITVFGVSELLMAIHGHLLLPMYEWSEKFSRENLSSEVK